MGASSASVKSDSAAIGRVPVVSANGERLMPCKPGKAKKLLEAGKAEEKRGNDGVSYIQLKFDPQSPVAQPPSEAKAGGILTSSRLAEVREEAKRKRIWYRVLPKLERDVLDLTIKCVDELKSTRLIDIVTKIVVKIKTALQNRLTRLMEQVGVPMAKKLGDIAIGWGNRTGDKWAQDRGFVRYLTVMDGAFQGFA